MIRDFVVGNTINEKFLCSDFQEGKTKSNKPYYSLELTDRSGKISAKVWDVSKVLTIIATGDIVEVSGTVEKYQESLQLNISSICVCSGEEPAEFLQRTSYDVEEMWECLMKLHSGVESFWCSALLKSIFEDTSLVKKFKTHSAAVSVHHAYVGGLLEHTLRVTEGANLLGKMYGNLNRDLLVTAASLHDIGKLYEISNFPENQYTLIGQCVGHVTYSALIVSKAMDAIEGFPDSVRYRILHCILAHHGKLEYGSPKIPAIPEAIIISRMDELDAILNQFNGLTPEKQWKEYNRYLGVKPGLGVLWGHSG